MIASSRELVESVFFKFSMRKNIRSSIFQVSLSWKFIIIALRLVSFNVLNFFVIIIISKYNWQVKSHKYFLYKFLNIILKVLLKRKFQDLKLEDYFLIL